MAKTHKIDEDTIWEETGCIIVGPNFVRKQYRELKKGQHGWTLVEGSDLSKVEIDGFASSYFRTRVALATRDIFNCIPDPHTIP